MMRQRFAVLLTASALLVLVTACVPLPPEQAATPTVSPIAATAIAQPTRGVAGVHPPSTRTGITEVDRVIEGVLSNAVDTQRALLQILSTPCTTREGLGGPPKCSPGEIEGTTVQAFPVGGPEGSFVRAAEIERLLPLRVSGLYAVYRVPADAYREPYWPAGDYGVVFLRPDLTFLVALVTPDGIVRLDYPAVRSPGELEQQIGGEFVLAPAGS